MIMAGTRELVHAALTPPDEAGQGAMPSGSAAASSAAQRRRRLVHDQHPGEINLSPMSYQ